MARVFSVPTDLILSLLRGHSWRLSLVRASDDSPYRKGVT